MFVKIIKFNGYFVNLLIRQDTGKKQLFCHLSLRPFSMAVPYPFIGYLGQFIRHKA